MTMYDLSRYDARGNEIIIEFGGHAVVEVRDKVCKVPIVHSDLSLEEYAREVNAKPETTPATQVEHLDAEQLLERFAEQAHEADAKRFQTLLDVGRTATAA